MLQWGRVNAWKKTIQIDLKRVKNPTWPEANQLSIYKHGRGFLTQDYRRLASGFSGTKQLGASDLQVQRCNHSATPQGC